MPQAFVPSFLALILAAAPVSALATDCCYPGERPRRCVQMPVVPDESPVAMQGRCDRILSADSHGVPLNNRFGLNNDQFTRNGFQGETHPVGAAEPPKHFSASDQALAIQSPACASMRPSTGACLNYFEVDAFIAFDDELSLKEVREFSALHPWKQSREYSDRVVTQRIKSQGDLSAFFEALTQDCFVVRHLFVSSHGRKGHVSIWDGETLIERLPVKWVLADSGLACSLAPYARVQFDGCSLGCKDRESNGADDLLADLTALAKNPNYAVPGDPRPLGGSRFLFNTGKGVTAGSLANIFVGRGWHWNRGIRAEANSAIMYQVGGGEVRTDVSTGTAMACDPDDQM